MSDSESPLSSAPDTEDEIIPPSLAKGRSFKSQSVIYSPPTAKKQRKKEPPHIPTFADIPEIAFIVAFQSRFNNAFKGIPSLGPQDIEAGVINMIPSEHVEQLLCRLLSLVLNRKKYVERGHHNRALEEAIQANQSQWPPQWEGRSPLSGGKKFDDLDAKQRLVLLKYLILWALASSEAIRTILSEHYRTSRRNDDLNVALSIQPWGRDGDKRRYWLIEGKEDTAFRLYRESNPALKNTTWISVAGTIDELKAVALDLDEHGNKHSGELARKIYAAVPRFEEGENKRKRREYRQQRRNYFSHQAAAYSYEGRTRGKRMKYTFSDDDEGTSNGGASDGGSARRSERTSRAGSSVPRAPQFTASGRQIRRPTDGRFGDMRVNGSHGTSTGAATPASIGSENGDLSLGARNRRDAARIAHYYLNLDDKDDSDEFYDSPAEEDEYKCNEEETDEDDMSMDGTAPEEDFLPRSHPVLLRYGKEGKVAEFLKRAHDLGTQAPNGLRSSDIIMDRSITSSSTNNPNLIGNGDQLEMRALPVVGARPVNGTTVTEIRSKGADAG